MTRKDKKEILRIYDEEMPFAQSSKRIVKRIAMKLGLEKDFVNDFLVKKRKMIIDI